MRRRGNFNMAIIGKKKTQVKLQVTGKEIKIEKLIFYILYLSQ